MTFTLNPIGDGSLAPYDNRIEPTVSFDKLSVMPSPSDFEGKLNIFFIYISGKLEL